MGWVVKKMEKKEKLSLLAITVNVLLFALKMFAYISSGSIAILSDSFNSLLDILSSVAIFFAVKISSKKADYDHPFGHRSAEPIAGFIMAIFAAILGFEVIKDATLSLFTTRDVEITVITFIIMSTAIALKAVIFVLFYNYARKVNSPAIKASSMDYRNDIIVSSMVIIGNMIVYLGFKIIDSFIAMIIGGFIIYSGVKIGIENMGFLMGKKPSEKIIERLKNIALSIEGVKALNDVKARYLGSYIQIEMHIEVDKRISTEKSHSIAKEVQRKLLEDEMVDFCFVHVDPV